MANDRPLMQIVIGSTRPGRVGDAIGRWFDALARDDASFEVELVDLATVNLPLLDEPHQPEEHTYVHDHTRRWSETVSRADAFVFVIPEYNHGVNAATKNALDYLYVEWRDKPSAIVCYGGSSRGVRAAQALKASLLAVKIPHAGDVAISLSATPVRDGHFEGDASLVRSATRVLHELARLVAVYRPLRT